MNKCADNDNSCTYTLYKWVDGVQVRKPKRRFETSDDAIRAAMIMNGRESTIRKFVAYKCSKCGYYHIGHSKKSLTAKDKEKAKKFTK
jgi:hypothetical protein